MYSKNIALMIGSLAGGGAEKVVISLAQNMLTLGHKPHIIVIKNEFEHCIPDTIKIHSLSDKKNNITDLQHRFLSLMQGLEHSYGKFDLFLANSDKTNQILANSPYSPQYFIIHNNITSEINRELCYGPWKYWRRLKAKKILNNKKLIGVSQGVIDCVKQSKIIKPKSTQVIYNPLDIKNIRHLAEQDDKDIPISPYILHVGRVSKQKRHDVLLKALKNIPDKYKLVLLCNNEHKLHKLAKQYGVLDRIITPGFKSNPYPWMKHASVTAFSSDFEGFGLVLAESLICGTPVVSTDCNYGPREILTGSLSDYLCPTNNSKALADVINKALTAYPEISHLPIFDKVNAKYVTESYLKLSNNCE